LCAIPWGHHCCILKRCTNANETLFFARETIKNGWSRSVLLNFLDADYYKRQGTAITNFKESLPAVESDLPSIEEVEQKLSFRK